MMRTKRGLRIIEGRWQEIIDHIKRRAVGPQDWDGDPKLRTARLELKTAEDQEIVIRAREDKLRNELVVDIRRAEDVDEEDSENSHPD